MFPTYLYEQQPPPIVLILVVPPLFEIRLIAIYLKKDKIFLVWGF
ncbi:hypothetical protein SAMN02787073_2406 [Chryseobacterium vrystaatense]|nr:hypothetical protein SAMN02787073_2406 [Chryseobacterium vrystaatense]